MTWKRAAGGGMVLAMWLLSAIGASAQTETGRIAGRIVDEQGGALPGVTVTATAVKTTVTRMTTTDGGGAYLFANVQPAEYEIKAELSGFRTVIARTTVGVGAAMTVDVKLPIGGLEETVRVAPQESSINVRTPEMTTTISQTQLRELPTITRNPYALAELAGTASDQDPSGRGAGISLNGLRGASTNVLLDGAANNDEFVGAVGQAVPLDAVQEFSVIANGFTAQYGRATGGIVNVLVKSGTNQLRGSAYEFFRDDKLATNTFDNKARGIDKSPFSRHQYGGSVGGPIKRDKAFFFGNVEDIRVRSNTSSIAWVPTPQFIAASAPATQNYFNAYHLVAPISGPTLTRGEISGATPDGPFAALPADLPIFGQVQQRLPIDAGGGTPQDTVLAVGKVDVALKPGMTFYARYSLEHSNFFDGSVSNNPWAGFNTGQLTNNHNILASLTNVWSPRFTTQSKAVFNRLETQQPLNPGPISPTLYMRSSLTSIDNVNIALPGYLPYAPATAIPVGGPQNFLQLYEDATRGMGRHELRFGGAFTRLLDDRTFGAFATSNETLGATFGEALDNLVRGQIRQFQSAVDPQGHFPGEVVNLPLSAPNFTRNNRYNEWAVYASDDWRLAPRVTANLGLRYEYYGVQHNSDPRLDSNFYPGVGANAFEQLRNGTVQIAQDSPVGGLWAPDKNNLAPRVGLAWDVFGDGRTSLRGSYGIGYERNFNNVTFNVIQNPPNSAVVSLVAGTDVPSIPLTADNAGPLAGTGSITLPRTSLRFVDPDIKTGYAHLWNVSFQRELFRTFTASVDYTGSAGRALYTIGDVNAPGSGPAYLGDLSNGPLGRVNTQYSNLNRRTNGGESRYDALVLGLDAHRVGSTGLSFTTRYTYGHAKDNLSTTFSESNNNFNLGLLDPFNPRLDYGDADYDIRHRFTGGFVWELPWLQQSTGVLHALAAGWQVASAVKMQTGAPFTVYDCTNANTRCMRLLVQPGLNRTPGSTLAPTGDPNSFVYLDLANQTAGIGSYANPLTGSSDFGPFPSNMDVRNSFRSPGLWNVDAIFSKRVHFGGRGLQLRLETYNLFNHANLFVRQDAVDVSASTQILAFRGDTGPRDGAVQGDGQRRIQLGIRFDF
jgi:Carboxypeptidase regulatory-like domain/TonB-dependent Receptor Plug Domain